MERLISLGLGLSDGARLQRINRAIIIQATPAVMPVGIHRYNDHGRHPNDRIGYRPIDILTEVGLSLRSKALVRKSPKIF